MSAAIPMSVVPADGVTWRALTGRFWVARRDGRHLGGVEHGSSWLATDAEGEPIGTYRSFCEAQTAVIDPAAHRAPVRRVPTIAPIVALLGIVSAASAAAWVWTALLP